MSRGQHIDGLVRLVSVAFRRYVRAPEERATASRLLLTAAINLHAAETSSGQAALAAAEDLAHLAQAERREQNAARSG